MEMMTPSDMLRGLWWRAWWQLYWAHCRNSSPSPSQKCFSWQPSLMEKHDSSPLIQTLLCHSEVNRQIIHQWDSIPPQLPLPLPSPTPNEQRQQSVLWLANEELWSGWRTLNWYYHSDGTQVFKCLTLMISNSLHMYHIAYRIQPALSVMIATLETITYWWTYCLRHFCSYIQ